MCETLVNIRKNILVKRIQNELQHIEQKSDRAMELIYLLNRINNENPIYVQSKITKNNLVVPKETKKETKKETNKETKKETNKETNKETKKETVKICLDQELEQELEHSIKQFIINNKHNGITIDKVLEAMKKNKVIINKNDNGDIISMIYRNTIYGLNGAKSKQ